MALAPCRECGTDVSDQASTCPKCGAPAAATRVASGPKRKGATVAVVILSLLVLGLGAVVLILALAFPSFLDAYRKGVVQGSATKVYTMNLSATDTWMTFNVAVNPGDRVTLTKVDGEWRIKPTCSFVGWRGHPPGTCDTVFFDGRIVKDANRGALLWRADSMQDSAFVAQVGKPITIGADQAGRLQFQINDDSLSDNEGALHLELEVVRH